MHLRTSTTSNCSLSRRFSKMKTLHLSCLFLLLFQAQLAVPVLAWMTNPKLSSTRNLSSTQIKMIDWFNKPKPSEGANTKKEENDFFTNLFNLASPPKVPKVEEPEVVEKVEEPKMAEPEVVAAKVETPLVKAVEAEAAVSLVVVAAPVVAATPAAEGGIHHGKVRWFDRSKGYGFIEPISRDDTNGQSVFVHQSELKADGYRYLFGGESIEYHQKVDEQGRYKAVDVTGPDRGPLRVTRDRKKRE